MALDNPQPETLCASERRAVISATHWTLPLTATVALHALMGLLLWLGWQPQPPAAAAQAKTITTQLVVLPATEPEVVVPPVETAALPPAPPPEPVRTPEPQVVPQRPPQPEPALLAREEAEQREEQERVQQQQVEREREEHARQQREAREQAERLAAEQYAAEQRRAEQAAARAAAAEQAQISAYAPLNKSAPDYPRRALSQSLEGDCTVEYTVQTNGRVSNAEVVPGACDERIFVRPSLAAAKEFVYRPRVVNGQAVAVPGVRNTFRYRIEQ